ncbi:SDR family NAD(P)-dependent oxidoreductase [Mesobacillus zeae]|uniref:SDR family NAD(P)-dependent oxidoreductase n=1 Tax=Mesobacillus zeae TaxID=1917180 RepID=A0A398BE80_9BACI|nr:SDR family NAD(P)-dependent oxidoreductase [Mesobacillus zeae]
MAGRFEGITAFVTGGSRGIGKGIVQFFAEEGAKVAFIDLNEDALGETTKELRAKGYCIGRDRRDCFILSALLLNTGRMGRSV